ncbi:outer membrane protein OmpA-like peptidoglycan-associated protein [Inquilinus ginsengisoli]|uniref:OmpA family protein n=1 Tax=Inquilinus ginsengisoli TaxID=363840 RepID=UPI003D1C0B98
MMAIMAAGCAPKAREIVVIDEGRRPFLVMFEKGSAALSPEQEGAVVGAAYDICMRETTKVLLTGEADDESTPPLNRTLSLRRAEAVRRKLIELGISDQLITVEAIGQEAPLFSEEDMKRAGFGRIVIIAFEPVRPPLGKTTCAPGYGLNRQ